MKTLQRLLLTVFAVAVLAPSAALAAQKLDFKTDPATRKGEKWRIAYYEGGPYIDYQKIFTETIRGLMKLGWIEWADIPPQEGEQTEQLWHWLATEAKSDYLEFLPDGHYSAAWEDQLADDSVATLMKRLNKRKDVDLLIAMGTRAGKDFANDKHHTPTMVLSASDPLSSGIIRSVEDSGFEHVHATVDPNRYERQIRVFHEIIGFKRLGVAYEDTVDGRSYAAIDVVEKVAAERGFEVVKCYAVSDVPDVARREREYVDCFRQLADRTDAIYVTVHGGVSARSIPELVRIAKERHIPTFSQSGSEEVKQGFLVSISQAGFKYVGEFHAQTFAKVFNGARPNQLDQLFEEPPKIALNLKTAEVIGFDPPIVILGAADEIF